VIESIILASHDAVMDMVAIGLPAGPGSSCVPPTASMQACGGLITAENSFMPNIPRFEILQQNDCHLMQMRSRELPSTAMSTCYSTSAHGVCMCLHFIRKKMSVML